MSTNKWYRPASGKGKTILVTGGNGFVAAQILNAFLSRGYNVRTTVRSTDKGEILKQNFNKYIDQLSYFIVKDIVEEDAFDEAVKGVDGTIHTASPFVMDVKDYDHSLIIPAIKGTTNILKAIQKNAPQIWRRDFDLAIYTTRKTGIPITYDVAANPATPVEVSYCASKAFAEKAAWDYVEENKPNFNLFTICPPMIYGPNLQNVTSLNHLNTSSADIYRLMNGSEKNVPNTTFFGYADVRDVGEVHARAYESTEAAGQRFLTTGGYYTYGQVCEVIRRNFPQLKDKTPDPSTAPTENAYQVNNEKARKELGMEFRSLETTIYDQVTEFLNLEKKLSKA